MKYTSLPKTRNEFLLEAVYAGIFSGSAVALLFLLLDTVDGQPLYTPSLFGSVLILGIDAEDAKVRLDAVAYFSVLHIVVFTALSAAVSFAVHEVELHSRHPALLLVLLFAIIEAGFFVVAPIAMPGVILEIGIVRLGVANLLAAIVLTLFFVVTHHAKTRGMFTHHAGDFLTDTVYAGAFGGSAVALFFLAIDSVGGQPFFTPALIGHMLFLGDSAQVVVAPGIGPTVVYVVPLHFAWSLGMGAIATWLVYNVEMRARHPVEVLLVFFVVVEAGFLLVIPLLLPGLIERLGIVQMLIANVLAAAAMSSFFIWSHTVDPGDRVPGSAPPDESEATPTATTRS